MITGKEVAMSDLHEIDRPAWAEEQMQALRELPPGSNRLDVEHLIEELEELVSSEKREVVTLARRIMEHLLCLAHSPAQGPRAHWQDEVSEFRTQLDDALTKSLRRHLEGQLDATYAKARRLAEGKLARHGEEEAAKRLPATCPYSLEQVLDLDWWPPEP
jgi:hypothetical protein